MKVLFIHMTGAFGGSSRSLSESVRAFPEHVEAHFLTPHGTVEPFFEKLGDVLPVRGLSQFDNTQYSHYRGFRWIVALRELTLLPATFSAIRQAKKKWPEIDVIHLNEFTGLLPLWLAKRAYGVPTVVHVRSVARLNFRALRTRLVNRFLRRHADAIIAIDETVRRSLPDDLNVEVVHNAFTPAFIERQTSKAQNTQSSLVKDEEPLKVGFVGNLLRVKGIDDLVEAARLVRQQGHNVQYIIVGDDARPSTTLQARILHVLGINQNIKRQVEEKIEKYDLGDNFNMVGFKKNIGEVYGLFDVLCFPSHFNAPGRPVFEAAFSAVPSIVGVTDPTDDTLIDGMTAFAVPPKSPELIAAAIRKCAQDRKALSTMGQEAKKLAMQNFSVKTNAAKLLEILKSVKSSGNPPEV